MDEGEGSGAGFDGDIAFAFSFPLQQSQPPTTKDEQTNYLVPEYEGRVMDAEMAKLQELTGHARTHEGEEEQEPTPTATDGQPQPSTTPTTTHTNTSSNDPEDEINRRSVYVGNVDYGSTPKELHEHFHRCGKVLRVTIMVDKFTGHPKGFAYIEFSDVSGANNALMLSNTTLRGRAIKVVPKRKNIVGMTRTSRGRGRGRGGSFFAGPYGPFMGARMPPFMPRGGFRGSYGPTFRGRGQSAAAETTTTTTPSQ